MCNSCVDRIARLNHAHNMNSWMGLLSEMTQSCIMGGLHILNAPPSPKANSENRTGSLLYIHSSRPPVHISCTPTASVLAAKCHTRYAWSEINVKPWIQSLSTSQEWPHSCRTSEDRATYTTRRRLPMIPDQFPFKDVTNSAWHDLRVNTWLNLRTFFINF